MSDFRSQPNSDSHELLQQKLEFAEFEWNRATDGMKERDARIQALESELAVCRPKAAIYDACRVRVDCLSRGEIPLPDYGAERIRELEAALRPFLAVAKVMEFYTEESMPEMTYPRQECESRYPDEPRCVTLTQADFARVAALQPKDSAK